MYKKLKYRVCTVLSFVWTKTTFDYRFNTTDDANEDHSPTDDANEDHSHSKFVEDWKTQMSEAHHKALQNSSHRKEKDIARNEMIKKLSPVLEQGDRVVIRNMSGRGGTGKMR